MPKVSKSKKTTPKKAAKPSAPKKTRQVTERQKAVVGPRNARAAVKKTSAPPKKAAAPAKKRATPAPKKAAPPAPRRADKSPDLAAPFKDSSAPVEQGYANAATTEPRRRGRPRKTSLPPVPPPTVAPIDTLSPVKRGRGRPRKNPVAIAPPAPPLTAPRPRGRPRKLVVQQVAGPALADVQAIAQVPRRTGNSRKSAQPPVTPT